MKKQTIPALLLVVLVLAGCLSVPAEAVDGRILETEHTGKEPADFGQTAIARATAWSEGRMLGPIRWRTPGTLPIMTMPSADRPLPQAPTAVRPWWSG